MWDKAWPRCAFPKPPRVTTVFSDPVLPTAIILFVAYLVRGIAGFGSGLIAIPLLAMMHPITLVVPMVVLLDYLGSAAQGLGNRQSIKWGELWPLLPFTLVGCAIALYLFTSVDPVLLKQALGWFILIFAIYQILPLPPLHGSRLWAMPAGMMGGLVGTLFGTGGPFYMIYLTIRGLDKTALRASFASYFFIDGSIRLVGFAVTGLLHADMLTDFLRWLPAAAIGLYIGGHVHLGISNKTFKYFVSLLLVFSSYRLLMH